MFLSEGLSEYNLARLLSMGFTCRQIGDMTGVSLRTVYNWRSRLIEQTEAKTIIEAVCKELIRFEEFKREFLVFEEQGTNEEQGIGTNEEPLNYRWLRWGVWGDGEIGGSEASDN